MKKIGILLILAIAGTHAGAQSISLEKAKEQALQHNRLLSIQQEKVRENEFKVAEARTKNKPMLMASGNYIFNGITKDLAIPAGSFGNLGGNPLPQKDVKLFEGKHNLLLGSVMAYQPISQLGKIKVGVKVAEADVDIAKTQVSKAELDILEGVEKLYYGLLINRKQLDEARVNVLLTQAKLYDVESALAAGKTDEVYKVGLQADLANQEQKILQITNQMEDYQADLKNLLGSTDTTQLVPEELTGLAQTVQPLSWYLNQAQSGNPDIKLAGQTIAKADYGIEAARKDKLPNIGVIGGYTYQNLIADLPGHNYFLGLNLSWNIYDFGKRKAGENQRASQKKQAEEYLAYTRDDVSAKIGKAYRKVTQTQRLVAVAEKAAGFRREEVRLKTNAREAGLKLDKDLLESKANLAKAEQDLYSAQMGLRLALNELENLAGVR